MQLHHPATHINTYQTNSQRIAPIVQQEPAVAATPAKMLEDTYVTIDNTNEAVSGTINVARNALPKVPRLLNFASSALNWVEESPFGKAIGKFSIPVLASIKTARAADAVSDGDGHGLARTIGSFAGCMAAIGVATAGLAAASTVGVVAGVAIGIGVIGFNIMSDDIGENLMDKAVGKNMQAGMDQRTRAEIAKIRQHTQDVTQPQGAINGTYHGDLWKASADVANLLQKRRNLVLPKDDKEGIQHRYEDIKELKGQLAQLNVFRESHAQELAHLPSVHAIAPTSVHDSNHGKDKEALATLKNQCGAYRRGRWN